MKAIWYSVVLLLLVNSCGINKQKQQIENLGKCKFEVEKIENARLAGVAIEDVLTKDGINLTKAPNIALGLLRKDVPFHAVLKLKIDNTTKQKAAINQFQYIIALGEKELVSGLVDQEIFINPGESSVASINLNTNLYNLIADKGGMEALTRFFTDKDAKTILTFKVKPAFKVAGKTIFYPGYITIKKPISQSMFL